ncbi:MAG: cell envelope integrity protein CreD [Chitinophagaceae bacterium]
METGYTENTTIASSLMDKGKLFLKAIIIFVMALGLWIPTYFIKEVISERESRQREAINDISSKWAGNQLVTGPVLQVPYMESTTNDKGENVWVRHNAFFMPDKMDINAVVIPEKRHRGIYQVVVYRSDISITGKFNPLRWNELKTKASDSILWPEANLLFQVSDNVKGINEDVYVNWNNNKVLFNPLPGERGMKDALVAVIPFTAESVTGENNFNLRLSLNGSEKLLFASSARENRVDMRSEWKDPSFTGMKLPDERKVSDSGFIASWKYMNRSIPMVWKDQWNDLSQTSVGADLVIPVDGYDKTGRSVKYALLCIILTFAAFFLIESIYKKSLHLIQYALAGLALVLFYTLLLSISEYLGFNLSYLLAGIATISLVAWYVGSIMKSSKLAIFISFVLTIVYGYIYSIIQLQDYALLMGSIGLFIALGIIMFFSRKLQW